MHESAFTLRITADHKQNFELCRLQVTALTRPAMGHLMCAPKPHSLTPTVIWLSGLPPLRNMSCILHQPQPARSERHDQFIRTRCAAQLTDSHMDAFSVGSCIEQEADVRVIKCRDPAGTGC